MNIKFSKVSILIYQLLKLIDNYEVSQEAKKQYSNILRACINDDLLRLLVSIVKIKMKVFMPMLPLSENMHFLNIRKQIQAKTS